MWVFVKGGCWRMDCWVWMECSGGGVVDDDAASDSRKKAR